MSFAKRLEEAQRAAQAKALGGEAAYHAYQKRKRRKDLVAKGIGIVIALVIALAIYSAVAWVIQWGWNAVTSSFDGPYLSYRGSCGIVVLLAILSMFFKRSNAKN